jgi:hypothetical protein
MANQKNLMDEYASAIRQKESMKNVEKDIERRQAQTIEATARQSLYKETSQRKRLLDKFKTDFKDDYNER